MSEATTLLHCNTPATPLRAPFPWFGGKSRAADLIWPRLGNVPNYVEPFAGSLAVLLRRPHAPGNEIVNDRDCYVANAWRAMQLAPDEVAQYADNPVNEADLHARHRWLHRQTEFRDRMEHDPDYFDARVAGWWIWGLSCWIGDNFCRPKPQHSMPNVAGEKGVARQLPDVIGTYNATESHNGQPCGKGVNAAEKIARKLPCVAKGAKGAKAATYGQGKTAILLDPPYDAGDSHDDVYGDFSRGVSGAVRTWAIENGDNPLLRIALCGYEGEHAMPPEWKCVEWKAAGGYGNQSADNDNASREAHLVLASLHFARARAFLNHKTTMTTNPNGSTPPELTPREKSIQMAQRELVSQALIGMVEEIEGRVPDDETILREGQHVQFADTALSCYEASGCKFTRFYVWRGTHAAALDFPPKDPLALRFALVPPDAWPVALRLWVAQQREKKAE